MAAHLSNVVSLGQDVMELFFGNLIDLGALVLLAVHQPTRVVD